MSSVCARDVRGVLFLLLIRGEIWNTKPIPEHGCRALTSAFVIAYGQRFSLANSLAHQRRKKEEKKRGKKESWNWTKEVKQVNRDTILHTSSVQGGIIYALGKAHMHATPSQKFSQRFQCWNGSNVRLVDDGPLSSFEGRSSRRTRQLKLIFWD